MAAVAMSVVYVLTTPIPKDGGIMMIMFAEVSCIIDKLCPSWKDFKHTLKHKKEELTLVELDSHLRIEESLMAYLCDLNAIPSLRNKKYFVTFVDDASRFCYVSLLLTKDEALDKLKVFKTEVKLHQRSLIKRFRIDRGGEYMDTLYFQLNIGNDNITSAFMSTSKLNDLILWHARLGHVHFKRMQHMSKDELILPFDMDTVNDLCDLHATPSLGNKKYNVTFIDDAL
ncbi:zinc finger, CCHC-type containing protein, partial [Tanacetum coccineum]